MKQIYDKGFTLIELLATLAVVAIVLSLGVPSLRTTIQDNERATQLNKLTATLRLAQSEAVKRSRNISVCRSADGATCGGTWTQGWIVFVNIDNDNPAAVDAGEQILRVHQDPTPAFAWTVTDTVPNAITSATYRPSNTINSGFFNTAINFRYCDSRGATQARAVIVNVIGRTQLSTDGADADTTHEDSTGANLTCP